MKRTLQRVRAGMQRAWGEPPAASTDDVVWRDRTFQNLQAAVKRGFIADTICDVGASNGRWSHQCMKVFPRARYFCIDPLQENQAALAQLQQASPALGYWIGCLGAHTGTVRLNADGSGSSVLNGHTNNPYGESRSVPMETLDNLIVSGICPPPDLLKLDVQGYELQVLQGAIRTLSRVQGVIAEVSFFPFQTGMPVFHEVVAYLADAGFAVYDIFSMRPRPLDGAPGQADLFFVRGDSPLRTNIKWDCDSVY